MNRRTFLEKGTLLSATPCVMRHLSAAPGKQAADSIGLGFIGLNGIGTANLVSALASTNTRLVAIADIDQGVIDKRMREFEGKGLKPKVYTDFRKLLEDKEVDAVVINTPDHWHTLMVAMALEAGKHVYVEKPLANTVSECLYLEKAANQYNKLKVQVGQQQRSAPHWADAMAYLHGGALGRIRQAKAWVYVGWKGAVPVKADEPVPAGVNYDMWLGPAPLRPFNINRFHFTFRWYWEYAGGLMTDWGVHMLDMALMGMKAKAPKSVVAMGGKFAYPDDAQQTPDTMQTLYNFGDTLLSWEHSLGVALGPYERTNGVAFTGENGTLIADRSGWKVVSEIGGDRGKTVYKMPLLPERRAQSDGRNEHFANWFKAIREGTPLACPIADASQVAMVAHLGNLALRSGQNVTWNDAKKQVEGNPEAQKLSQHRYRAPWVLPKLA